MVFAAAKHLKLDATLQPIWKGHEHDDDRDEDVLGDSFAAQMHDIWDEDFVTEVQSQMMGELNMEDVTWCTGDKRAWSEDHAIATYGNEPATSTVYSAAAITVDVPPWSERAFS